MSDIYKSPEAELHDPVSAGEYGSVEMAIEGRYSFQVFALLGEAWATLKGMKGEYWGAVVMLILVSIGLGLVFHLVAQPAADSDNIGLTTVIALIQQIVTTLITAPMSAGIVMLALKHATNTPTSATEIFAYFSKAPRLLLLNIILYVMIFIGFLLFILPGIYLMVAWSMAVPLAVEKNMGVWQALETSRKAVTKKWFKFLGLFLLFMVVITIAAIPLFIGLIWVLPWVTLAYAMLYRNMFGVTATTTAATTGTITANA